MGGCSYSVGVDLRGRILPVFAAPSSKVSNYVYDGNILILDYSAIMNDDLSLKRIVTELKRLVEDTEGDMAGISKNLLIIAPKQVKIDRKKLHRGTKY